MTLRGFNLGDEHAGADLRLPAAGAAALRRALDPLKEARPARPSSARGPNSQDSSMAWLLESAPHEKSASPASVSRLPSRRVLRHQPCGVARAQSDTGEIVIAVVDAANGKPVGNARTILVGPQTASSLTTAAGKIDYTDVPTGIYRVRVLRSGYQSGVSNEFDVLNGRTVMVRVSLSTSTGGLRIIGTSRRVRPSASVRATSPTTAPFGASRLVDRRARSDRRRVGHARPDRSE